MGPGREALLSHIYIYLYVSSKGSTEAEGVRVAAALSHKPFSKSVGYVYIYIYIQLTFSEFSVVFPYWLMIFHVFSIIPFFLGFSHVVP